MRSVTDAQQRHRLSVTHAVSEDGFVQSRPGATPDRSLTLSTRKWQAVSLGAICEFKYGKSLPGERRIPGDTPVFGSNGRVGSHNEAFTSGATIVIGRKGSFGEVNFSPVACWPIDTTYYIDQTATTADLRWLVYRLAALGLTKMNKSAAVPGLNREDAYRLQVLLPPLPEQRRIADVLDRADTLRAMRRQVIVDLDALTYAIFHDLFETHADSSWQTVRMDDVAEIITGFPFRSDRYVANDGVRLCRGANVLPGRIDWTDLASWPKAEEEEFADFRLRPGDVLIAMDRPWIAEGFKIAQIQSQDCPSLLVQRVARIRAKSGLSNDFLLYLLNQPFFARHCKPTETTVPHISPKEIRSFCFSLPPHSLQAQFSRFMTAFKQLKALQMKSLGEIDALFASLQDGAFGSVSGR